MGSMDDRTVIVTGGNAGLGYQCAKNIALADPGYRVVIACRSPARGEAAAERLRAETGNPHVAAMTLDLASLNSVRAFCAAFAQADTPKLYGIVCNAGISAGGVPGSPTTADGFEMIFGVNHLGHFLLTNLLLPEMDAHGRIVFVTSDLHDPPGFFPTKVRYDRAAAIAQGSAGIAQYCMSKLCNLYCAYELDRRLRADAESSISVNAFNPGAMADTGFSRPTGNVVARAAVRAIGGVMGALIGKRSTATESGASPLSYDRANAEELWNASRTMTGLEPDTTG